MKHRTIAAALLMACVYGLAACSGSEDESADSNAPSAAASNPSRSESEPGVDTDDPEAAFAAAVDQLKQAPAVAVDVTADLVQSTTDSTATSTGAWTSDPTAWRMATTNETPPESPFDTYTLDALFRDGGTYLRLSEDDERPGSWGEDGHGFAFVPNEYLETYPVAPLVEASFVDAVSLSDVTVVRATVPNEVINLWFGLEAFLNNHGLAGVLEGGESQVSITVDESGFPVKLTCAGSGITLNEDIPMYVAQDLAESRLTMYFDPIDVPALLRRR